MRPRRRMQHPGRESRHLRLSAERMLAPLARFDKRGGMRLVRLWRQWEEIVGPEVAELARPVGHKDQALILTAEDAVAAQQLSYYAPELLERVNAFFGEEVFDKVRFELLNGRVPLGENKKAEPERAPQPSEKPLEIGGLLDKIDPDTALGRCYLAYVRHYAPLRGPTKKDENTRPKGASRRRK